ncbi:family 1 glycosylhydrolase [Sphingobium sp. SCG-1]|uniref:family 1 glycosylhydrolase n=1 Tax=Sphingobium sp. SCG-1 TaxID=2072936 RepID=UPI0016706C9C|nr:family 1 glycosylhydrolase [Sphingobium sp. SCG-1]
MTKLELWGGLECTINRVADRFTDQTMLSGHADRVSDIDLFADLGISALRYPVLWDKIAPTDPEDCDWSWADERLKRLRARGLRVIAGLVHHGSGPRYTDLLDDGFAQGLAAFAAKAAKRYPWIEDWTPVNEPLTTARFSALYGHWYPHTREEGAFWRALLNQIDGVRLSMRAIRAVNPAACLVQTEDLGRTYATAQLRQQAGFENMRRWVTWDLLCGRIIPEHPLWNRIARYGLTERLQRIAEDPIPPDVIGINHYATSDRFLDHRLQRYPARAHGGNGEVAYADVEGIRVLDPAPQGLAGALREAWERYRIPVAITEAHIGCTREEQMRWMADAWDTAVRLQAYGVDLRAVTSWSLLGSHGWNTLLTRPGIYETGIFDVRSGTPRPTAMVPLLKGLASDAARHPVLGGSGWWRRPIRLEYHPVARPAAIGAHTSGSASPVTAPDVAPLLICGATGTLGQAFARACVHRDIRHVLTSRKELAVDDANSIARVLDELRPWAVVNATGWVRVDDAEDSPTACFEANTTGARLLAEACEERGIQTLSFSSDLVFDGREDKHYIETDMPHPLNVYGHSKGCAEAAISALPGAHLIVRTAAFFSPHDPHNFAVAVARALRERHTFPAADDHFVSPTYVPDLVDAALDLLIDGERGVWHLTNNHTLSWADFARMIARAMELDETLVQGVPGTTLGWRARRPACAGLVSTRGAMLRSLDEAVAQFALHIEKAKRTRLAQAA